jgi:hypothetical protein
MKRERWILISALVVAGLLGLRWVSEPRPPERVASPGPVALGTQADSVADPIAGESSPAPDPLAAESADPPRGLASASFDPRSDPELRDRARQHELAAEADARWQQAVDSSGYEARDLDESVRALFQRVDLEPLYAEGGRIDGLVIMGMPSDHPFAGLGLQPGDRIERIQGVELRDPADLPSLLAHLGPRFAVCARRGAAELCGDVDLE